MRGDWKKEEEVSEHPGKLLCHPWMVMAVAVVAVNDHVLKGSGWVPGWLTGKVSDVAGLFFFPVFLAVLLWMVLEALGWRRWGFRACVEVAAVLTVVVFGAINLSATANELAGQVWGVFTLDPTDLLCLPMVAVGRAFALGRVKEEVRESGRRRVGWREMVALYLVAVVSVATSAPPYVTLSGFPHWTVVEHRKECRQSMEVTHWIPRSGKEGFGLLMRFDDGLGEIRRVEVERAVVHLQESLESLHGSVPTVEARPVEPVEIDGRGAVYIPFLFDNEGAWNEGLRRGTIYVDLRIDGRGERFRFQAEHRSAEFSVQKDREMVMREVDVDGERRWMVRDPVERIGGCGWEVP